jgi:energy-coupling factor transporter ATP-binding protein EcfA2
MSADEPDVGNAETLEIPSLGQDRRSTLELSGMIRELNTKQDEMNKKLIASEKRVEHTMQLLANVMRMTQGLEMLVALENPLLAAPMLASAAVNSAVVASELG